MGGVDLFFRKATPSDAPSLLRLVRSAYRGDASRAGWTTEADLVSDDRIDEAGLLKKITEPNGQVLVAFSSGSAISRSSSNDPAHAGGEEEEEESKEKEKKQPQQPQQLLACCEIVRHPAPSPLAYLGLFSVTPALQNAGIGRKVLAEAERFARAEMGAGVMEMHVLWMRSELIAYYGRRGYEVLEGKTLPFPYAHLVNPKAGLRQDLHFIVMQKILG